jgi:hypothetical protein
MVVVLALTAYLSGRWIFGGDRYPWPIDFQVFWSSGGRSLNDVYADHGMPFAYPPTSLFLFKPLSLVSFLPGYFGWLLLSAALFGFAVAKTCGAKVSALSFISPAATKGITLGQSAMLFGGAMFAALQLRPVARGAVFGSIAAIKPQLVLLAPIVFLVRREWTALAGLACALAVTVLASIIAFGTDIWMQWLRALPHFHDLVVRHNVHAMAISPAARAEYLGYPVLPVLLFGAAIGLAAIFAMAKRLEGEMLIALIVATSLVASPYAHTHDTIALIPACIALLLKGNWPMAVVAALVLTGLPAFTPVGLLAALLIAIWHSRKLEASADYKKRLVGPS